MTPTRLRALTILLSASALAACNLAPKYVRPVGAVPATLPEGGVYPQAMSDAPDVTAISSSMAVCGR